MIDDPYLILMFLFTPVSPITSSPHVNLPNNGSEVHEACLTQNSNMGMLPES